MRNLFAVDQHPIGNWVVVADDRIRQLEHKGICIESERLDTVVNHFRQEGGARVVGMLGKPRLKPCGNTAHLRHPRETRRWVVHGAPALGQSKLTE
jgi:hypothetical protein